MLFGQHRMTSSEFQPKISPVVQFGKWVHSKAGQKAAGKTLIDTPVSSPQFTEMKIEATFHQGPLPTIPLTVLMMKNTTFGHGWRHNS